MRAETGAIEKVKIVEDCIFYEVIDNVEPTGVCGTGLIDLVAELLSIGIIDETGKICSPEDEKLVWHRERIIELESGLGYIVVPSQQLSKKKQIVLTQKDVRELQLAKAAFIAGIKILAKELGIRQEDIENVLIAGAFGTYINKYNAQKIGLIPNFIDPEKVGFVGNAASIGAKKYLLSLNSRNRAQTVIESTRYVELSARLDFQEYFAEAMFFDFNY
jgi:uncharacterized 2Fe-2S/4Fe-4S cluster protein (DUF4445 family)